MRTDLNFWKESDLPLRRFQSLGPAELNNLSPKVFFGLAIGDINKTPGSWLRRKLYLDGSRIIMCYIMQNLKCKKEYFVFNTIANRQPAGAWYGTDFGAQQIKGALAFIARCNLGPIYMEVRCPSSVSRVARLATLGGLTSHTFL